MTNGISGQILAQRQHPDHKPHSIYTVRQQWMGTISKTVPQQPPGWGISSGVYAPEMGVQLAFLKVFVLPTLRLLFPATSDARDGCGRVELDPLVALNWGI